jgi:hypothetical protein
MGGMHHFGGVGGLPHAPMQFVAPDIMKGLSSGARGVQLCGADGVNGCSS